MPADIDTLVSSLTDIKVEIGKIQVRLEQALEKDADYEVRIRGLEKFRWILVGAGSVGGTVLNQIISQLTP